MSPLVSLKLQESSRQHPPTFHRIREGISATTSVKRKSRVTSPLLEAAPPPGLQFAYGGTATIVILTLPADFLNLTALLPFEQGCSTRSTQSSTAHSWTWSTKTQNSTLYTLHPEAYTVDSKP